MTTGAHARYELSPTELDALCNGASASLAGQAPSRALELHCCIPTASSSCTFTVIGLADSTRGAIVADTDSPPDPFGRRIDVGSFTLALIGVFAVVGIRLLSAVDWNPDLLRAETAGMSFQGLPSLVISIVSTDIRDTTILLASIALYLYIGAIAVPPRTQRWAVAFAVLLTLLLIRGDQAHYAKSTELVILVGGATLGTLWILMVFSAGSDKVDLCFDLAKGAAVLIAFAATANIATQRVPWVPEEDIVTAQTTTRGWVIGENSNSQWLRVLTDSYPRRAVLIRIGDITSRSIRL